MLVTEFRKRFVRPPNPAATHLRCYAYFEEDISEVLPYLNTVLNGHRFSPNPPSLTLKFHGKLITLTAHEIAINIVKDEAEADEILNWLKKKINETWKGRGEITPSFEIAAKPRILEILKLLPKPTAAPVASLPVSSLPSG
jgi:ArsR family metal-binding transcriptional regulator